MANRKNNTRDERRKAFMRRQQKSRAVSEGGGYSILKDPLPDGVSVWKPGKGPHELDIIPYVAGGNDPDVAEGEWTWFVEVYVHTNVGVDDRMVVCLQKTYGKPCPICEHRLRLIEENADEEMIKEVSVKRFPRTLYNVYVWDSPKEEEKGVQVFHASHYMFQKELNTLSQSSPREIAKGLPAEKFIADPDEGYTVGFRKTGERENTRFEGIQLIKRDEPISDDLLDQAHTLDELLYIPSYAEVYEAYWGEPYKGSDSGQESTKSADEVDDKSYLDADYGQSDSGRDSEDSSDVGDDADASETSYTCPYEDGEFGVTNMDFDECDTCSIFDACLEASDADSAEDAEEAGPPSRRQASTRKASASPKESGSRRDNVSSTASKRKRGVDRPVGRRRK